MSLYSKIKDACKEKGVRVSRLENECGFSRSTISKWDEHVPGADKLKLVAHKLDKPLEYFYDDIPEYKSTKEN